MKTTKISKELKELSKKLKKEGHPNFHNEARRLTNLKYGRGWRDRLCEPDQESTGSREVLDMIADDLPDGAYFAMAEEMNVNFY